MLVAGIAIIFVFLKQLLCFFSLIDSVVEILLTFFKLTSFVFLQTSFYFIVLIFRPWLNVILGSRNLKVLNEIALLVIKWFSWLVWVEIEQYSCTECSTEVQSCAGVVGKGGGGAGSAYWSSRLLCCAFFFTPNNYWRCHGNCSHSLAIGTTLRCLSASVSILYFSSPYLSPPLLSLYYSRNILIPCYMHWWKIKLSTFISL